MSTQTLADEIRNPFRPRNHYSPDVVELMRALSEARRASRQVSSSPSQVLQVVLNLGYQQPVGREVPAAQEALRFVRAMDAFQEETGCVYPSCEDLLTVLSRLGYFRRSQVDLAHSQGLPIDRRRREQDERRQRIERRSSLEPSPQELLDLTADEHLFLDALKRLRKDTGRQFASSEELLSILWDLSYRPLSSDGTPLHNLSDEQRCQIQIRFTRAVENFMGELSDQSFLTCRTVLELAAETGLFKVD